jgi:hypothetical protein
VPISPVMLASFGKIISTAPARRLIDVKIDIHVPFKYAAGRHLLGFPVGEQHANFLLNQWSKRTNELAAGSNT